MATTTIPWGDGSGDNIYLVYPAASGDQTVQVSSDANTGAARTKVVTFSASGVTPVTLTVEQAAGVGNLIVPIYGEVYPVYNETARGFTWEIPSAYTRIAGVVFDGGVYYATSYRLRGSDTLTCSFKASQNCNVLGCYTTTSATTNYSLYVSTTSSAKYLRYNGGTYNSSIVAGTRYDVTISPTGSSGMRVDSSWTEATFTAESDMLIGTTSTGATSSKLVGTLYGEIEVKGRALFIPVKRVSDGAIGYYDVFNGAFLENQGNGTPTELI